MSASESPIFPFAGDDPDMERAAANARKTFRYFWRELAWEYRRIVPALDLAAVKAAFSDPPDQSDRDLEGFEREHMWIIDVEFDGRRVSGTLINSPRTIKSVKEGDQVSIGGKQIEDWMYVKVGVVCGGFTVDLLRSRMSKSERKQHDEAWGFDFGEVGITYLVPPNHLEDKPQKKKGLFSGFSKPKQEPQDFDQVAKLEHPMSVNMRDSLDEALAEDPQAINEMDDNGFTYLHQLALAGSWDGVDICLKHGADPTRKAENGLTPYLLAKSLGWKRVMARLQEAGGA